MSEANGLRAEEEEARRERKRAYNRAYYQANKDKFRESGRRFTEKRKAEGVPIRDKANHDAWRRTPEQIAKTAERDTRYRERRRKYLAAKRIELKIAAVNAYGGKQCFCCGETHLSFLTIDHIDNNGAAHRRQLKSDRTTSADFYKWLKDHDYPPGFQVACFNCNTGRHINGGVCPHQEQKGE